MHLEVELETDICNHLGAHGWLYATPSPQAWEAISKNHGGAAEAMLLDRLRKALDERGTLEVLRVGLDLLGLKSPLKLVQFGPPLAMNPGLQARYAANRLRVVRHWRTNHDDIIDLVLRLKGIPVATAELKTDFTQDINAAVDQYRFDRIPRPEGRPFSEFHAGRRYTLRPASICCLSCATQTAAICAKDCARCAKPSRCRYLASSYRSQAATTACSRLALPVVRRCQVPSASL